MTNTTTINAVAEAAEHPLPERELTVHEKACSAGAQAVIDLRERNGCVQTIARESLEFMQHYQAAIEAYERLRSPAIIDNQLAKTPDLKSGTVSGTVVFIEDEKASIKEMTVKEISSVIYRALGHRVPASNCDDAAKELAKLGTIRIVEGI